MTKHCGSHPLWTVYERGVPVQTLTGTSATFPVQPAAITEHDVPRVINFGIEKVWWLRDVKPRIYQFRCHGCNTTQSVDVYVYPAIISQVSLHLKTSPQSSHGTFSWQANIDRFKKAMDVLKEIIPNCPEIEFDALEGMLVLSNTIAEDPSSNGIQWSGLFEMQMNPLLKVGVEFNFSPIALPEAIKKYAAQLNPFVQVEGSTNANGKLEWINDLECHGDVKASGDITLKIGLKLAVLSELKNGFFRKFSGEEGLIGARVDGQTTLTLDADITGSAEPQVHLGLSGRWTPPCFEFELSCLDGFLSFDLQWKPFKDLEKPLGSFALLPTH